MLRVMAFGVRKSIPVVIWAAGVFGFLIMQDMALWLRGAHAAVADMGNDAVDRAARQGVPSNYHPLVYWAATALAVVELLIGWVALSFITVWLVKMFI